MAHLKWLPPPMDSCNNIGVTAILLTLAEVAGSRSLSLNTKAHCEPLFHSNLNMSVVTNQLGNNPNTKDMCHILISSCVYLACCCVC